MGLFDFFKKKKTELTEHEKAWNNLWDLWSEGLVESPYTELMTYQSEINNGGHGQYFTNIENTGDLQKEMSVLETTLSSNLKSNLQKAYKAYLALEENENDEASEKIIEQCDDVFFKNEKEINDILEAFAEKIILNLIIIKIHSAGRNYPLSGSRTHLVAPERGDVTQ